ncbi:MAG TPA: ComF family protein [Methylibium sp.]|nr:ComF family protein [Methylibium sp.]
MRIGRPADWIERARVPLQGLRRLGGALPDHCAVCRAPTRAVERRLCGDCVTRFAPPRPRCERCALPLPTLQALCGGCLREPPPWSSAVAACDYGHPWDGLLAALKFDGALDLAPGLAGLLARRLAARAPVAVDAMLPVPLAPRRLRERGYNQASLLAQAVARARGVPVREGHLLRLADTPPQLGLSRTQRRANLRGAFAVEPLALSALRGQRLALVDDVMTTGATLAEASRSLLAAGAAEVQVWVVARTPD